MSNKTTVIGSELSAALDAKNKRITELEAERDLWVNRALTMWYWVENETTPERPKMNEYKAWFDKIHKALESE